MTIRRVDAAMDEAKRCDRVALIQGGRLLAIDTPQAIARLVRSPAVRDPRRAIGIARCSALRAFPHTASRSIRSARRCTTPTTRADVSPDRIAAEVRAFLSSQGFADAVVEATAPTVEDSFMARMGAPEGTSGPYRLKA